LEGTYTKDGGSSNPGTDPGTNPGGGGSTSLANTTWKASMMGTTITLTFTGSTYTMDFGMGDFMPPETGTYSVSGNTVTLTYKGESSSGTLSENGTKLTRTEPGMGDIVFTKLY